MKVLLPKYALSLGSKLLVLFEKKQILKSFQMSDLCKSSPADPVQKHRRTWKGSMSYDKTTHF